MLHHNCARPDLPTIDDVADLHSHKVAAAQFAVDGNVKKCTITQAAAFVEIKSALPYLFRLERALSANSPPHVLYWMLIGGCFILRCFHDHSPVTKMVTRRMCVGLKVENSAALIERSSATLIIFLEGPLNPIAGVGSPSSKLSFQMAFHVIYEKPKRHHRTVFSREINKDALRMSQMFLEHRTKGAFVDFVEDIVAECKDES